MKKNISRASEILQWGMILWIAVMFLAHLHNNSAERQLQKTRADVERPTMDFVHDPDHGDLPRP